MVSTSNLDSQALSHRVLALRGLNEALSSSPKTSADGDAILAACYALAMQSSYIGDSVEEFLTMFRGCHIVIAQQWPERLGSVFRRLDVDCQLHMASSKLIALPIIDSRLVAPARESLEALRLFCQGMLEKGVLEQLIDIVRALETSSREG
jgi:hypothetical protein